MMSQQRYHSLDFLRAVMMFLGVVLHGAQMYLHVLVIDDYYLDPMRSVSMDVILVVINTFRMPTFFLLSGFFVALLLHRGGMRAMLQNRWQRITLPLLVLLPPLALIMSVLTVWAANWLNVHELQFDLRWIDNPIKLLDKTHNLWFLYYLTMMIVLSALAVLVWQRLPIGLKTTVSSLATRVGPLTAFLLLALLLALIGSLSETGRIKASVVFMPQLDVLLYFGGCYVFGWLLFHRQGWLAHYQTHGWTLMVLASITLLVSLVFFVAKGNEESALDWLFHWGLSLFSGFTVAFFMVALLGLFQRYFHQHSPFKRYLSDSAYWVFVSHSVFLVALAFPMAHLGWSAIVKFQIVTIGAVFLCLLTYHYGVRNTALGVLLNGRRHSVASIRRLFRAHGRCLMKPATTQGPAAK